MRVAVTGAAGFIGSPLVDRLLSERHDVTVLVRREPDDLLLRERGVSVILGDVRDEVTVGRAVRGAEVVYHMARAKGHGAMPASEVQSTNVAGTAIVADVSARSGVRSLVSCSSIAVYGHHLPDVPIDESAPLRPDSAYGRSKAAAEDSLRARTRDGFDIVIARISAVLGPGCLSWLSFVRSIGRRRLPVIGAGANWHHPADVADIVDGLVLCGRSGTRSATYNLAGPEPVRLRELMARIAEELGARPPRSIPAAPIGWYLRLNGVVERYTGKDLPSVAGARFLTSNRRFDLTRANRELGFQPKVGVREAVKRTVDWYRSEGFL